MELSLAGELLANVKRGRVYGRRPSGATSCVHRGLAVRRRRPSKVKSIEPHLLGSSMLLASVVQMGGGGRTTDEEEREKSACRRSESDGEEVSDDDVENTMKERSCEPGDQMHLAQGVVVENLRARPLLRTPRCLRRNSSHLLPADAVVQSDATGVYGRYNAQTSNQMNFAVSKPLHTSVTSPSLRQPAPAGPASDQDAGTDGSVLPKSCSSPVGVTEGAIYYDPYSETWDNFLSYVTHRQTHKSHPSI